MQRRATKIVPSIRNLNYQSHAIGITTLKERRDREDLIQMYKLTSNRNQAKLQALRPGTSAQDAQLPSSNLRRSKARLARERCQSKARDNFFTNRVCQIWNELPDPIVNAISVNSFKNKLDKFRHQPEAVSQRLL